MERHLLGERAGRRARRPQDHHPRPCTGVPGLEDQPPRHDAGARRDRFRSEMSGTHHGSIFGVAATGKHLSFRLHEFHAIKDRRVTTTWHIRPVRPISSTGSRRITTPFRVRGRCALRRLCETRSALRHRSEQQLDSHRDPRLEIASHRAEDRQWCRGQIRIGTPLPKRTPNLQACEAIRRQGNLDEIWLHQHK